MVSRQKERIGGIIIFFLGIFLTYLTWTDAMNNGSYLIKGAAAGPIFSFLGLGMIMFTSYKHERVARGEDISKLKGMQLITPRWWTILAIGLVAALVNLYFLGYFELFK